MLPVEIPNKMRNLIVFEFEDEIRDFISQRSLAALRDEDTTILAIQSCAQAFLRRRNISYLNTIAFIDKESHQNILLKSAEIIEPLRDFFDLKDDIGVKKGYSNAFIFCLRHYSLLYILWLIEIMENAIGKLRPEMITVVANKYYPDKMNCVPQNERLISFISARAAGYHGIKHNCYTGGRKNRNDGISGMARDYALEILKLFAFYFNLFILSYKSKGKKLILYSSDSYNLKTVIESFLHAFDNIMSVVLFEKPVLANIGKRIKDKKRWSIMSSLPYIWAKGSARFYERLEGEINAVRDISLKDGKLFTYRGVDFSEPVLLKLKKEMVLFLAKLHGQTFHLNKLINRIKPALFISQASRTVLCNMGEIASIDNIPSLMISHGSHVPVSNEFENIEWREHDEGLINTPYKYLAVQSPWALAHIKEKPSDSKPLITGGLLFTNIRKIESRKADIRKRIVPRHCDEKIILHAGTPKPFQSSRPYVYETIDEYINNINSLIKAVEKLKDTHLIIRFRPSPYLKLNDFAELLNVSNCYSVHPEGSFADYLAISDILVSYSSTAIEEALHNKVPVLMYDPQGRYCHIKEATVLGPSGKQGIDSCYYVNSEDNLAWAMEWLIKNHFQAEIPDFLWGRHIFSETETVNLPVYFRSLFEK